MRLTLFRFWNLAFSILFYCAFQIVVGDGPQSCSFNITDLYLSEASDGTRDRLSKSRNPQSPCEEWLLFLSSKLQTSRNLGYVEGGGRWKELGLIIWLQSSWGRGPPGSYITTLSDGNLSNLRTDSGSLSSSLVGVVMVRGRSGGCFLANSLDGWRLY